MKGKQFGVYGRFVISYQDHVGVSNAKIAAAERREARDSLTAAAAAAAALTSATKKP